MVVVLYFGFVVVVVVYFLVVVVVVVVFVVVVVVVFVVVVFLVVVVVGFLVVVVVDVDFCVEAHRGEVSARRRKLPMNIFCFFSFKTDKEILKKIMIQIYNLSIFFI